MKKSISLFLILAMLLTLVACGKTSTKLEGVEAPVDILESVWNSYGEDEKFFAMGGDLNHVVDNAPGAFDLADTEALAAQLVCPAPALEMIDAAASLMHAMNANNFTAAAYHVADAGDLDAFVSTMKEAIEGNQWMCGFPEQLVIATLGGEYVVVAFGAGDLITPFKEKLSAAYPVTVLAVEETLA